MRHRSLNRLDLDVPYQLCTSPLKASVRMSLAYLEMQRYKGKDKSFEVLDQIVENAQTLRIG